MLSHGLNCCAILISSGPEILGKVHLKYANADQLLCALVSGSGVQVNAQSVLRRRITFAWLDSLVVSGQTQMADSV